ncbi:hypothetical protein O988_05416 [Pseudogymnoascus sp. VKM F-3808]|nr:hypothetical protein O988_05416 [Pseudogymnoascus sp. VKM F-3808]
MCTWGYNRSGTDVRTDRKGKEERGSSVPMADAVSPVADAVLRRTVSNCHAMISHNIYHFYTPVDRCGNVKITISGISCNTASARQRASRLGRAAATATCLIPCRLCGP